MKWYFWIVLVGTDITLVLATLKLFRSRRFLSADKVAAAAGLLSLNAFLFIRSFVIDRSQCGESPGLACLLNTNRGVWTFGALCIAAATLYVNARMKQQEQFLIESKARDSATKVVSAALDELVHNLQHFANEIDDDNKFISFPATSLESTYALLRGEVATFCAPQVTTRVSNLQRITHHNRAMLRSAAEIDGAFKTIALMDDEGVVVFSRSKFFKSLQFADAVSSPAPDPSPNSRGFSFDLVRCDDRVITHSVRCVMEIAMFHSEAAAHILSRPAFGWLTRFRSEAHAKGSYSYCYYTKSSEVDERVAAGLRAKGSRLYCWIKDRDIDNLEIISLRTAFRDLYHVAH